MIGNEPSVRVAHHARRGGMAGGGGAGVVGLRRAAVVVLGVVFARARRLRHAGGGDGRRAAAGARRDEWAAQVRVWRGTAPIAVQPRMALQPGDLVRTGPDAYAVLYFQNAEVLMRPNSQGRVGSLTDVIGEVFAKIRGAFSVETTFVRAGARGTAYLVRGADDGAAVVTVFDGTVTLSSRVGAWAPYELPTGATAYCPPRAGAVQARQATPGELGQTRDWVEKIEKLVAPRTNYGKVAAVAGIAVLLGIILSNQGRGNRPSSDANIMAAAIGRLPTRASRAPATRAAGASAPARAPAVLARAPFRRRRPASDAAAAACRRSTAARLGSGCRYRRRHRRRTTRRGKAGKGRGEAGCSGVARRHVLRRPPADRFRLARPS